MFNDIANPFGTAAFEQVAWPMPELNNKKLVREVRRQLKPLRAPKPLSHHVKNFLLNYNG